MNFYNRLSLKNRVIISSLIQIFLNVAMVAESLVGFVHVTHQYEHVANINLPNTEDLGEMLSYKKDAYALALKIVTSDLEDESELHKKLKESLDEYEIIDKNYQSVPFVEGEAELYEPVAASWKKFKTEVEEFVALERKSEDKAASLDSHDKAMKEFEAANVIHENHLEKLIKFQSQEAKKWQAIAAGATQKTKTVQLILLGIVVAVALALGIMFANSLSSALSRIGAQIAQSTQETLNGGQHLATASSELSSGASEAAAALQETVASLEELTSMVKMNTEKASEANRLSQDSKNAAQTGEVEIQRLSSAMDEIVKGSRKIEEIITVIDDIAFQTNLLALNAAVEAARAGEQGRGFAVVAEAVRALAQRSAVAAKDISSLIRDSAEKAHVGSETAQSSISALKKINETVETVSRLNDEIASASQEQSHGIEQIAKAMNDLDKATQNNAASTEEVAATSEEMSQQAQSLAEMVLELQKLILGHKKALEDKVSSHPSNSRAELRHQAAA